MPLAGQHGRVVVPLDPDANICSMPAYRYTVAEYDPRRPWVVLGPLRHFTVELEDGDDFAAWAAQAWPRPRYQVDLLPELGPWEGAG
jgi:hypothetical protein